MAAKKRKKKPSTALEGGIFQELWDRQVIHTFLIYLGSSWGMTSFISLVANRYGLSPKVLDLAYIFVLSGLPAAVTIAYFHGKKGKQRMPLVEIIILSIISLFVLTMTIRTIVMPVSTRETTTESYDEFPVEQNSIAVLYFDNMSATGEDEYLSDGITEDIITGLTRLRVFQVSPRSAVLKYKDVHVDIKGLRNELRVSAILEGSIRRVGDRLRITAQLFETKTGFHIWAESFDREFAYEDVFDILDEVTEKIVKALEINLGEYTRTFRQGKPTENIEAYDLYLKGKYRFYKYSAEENLRAIEFFKRAIALDGKFAEAYAGAADALGLAYHRYWDRDPETLRESERYARKALELNEELPEAHAALGTVYLIRWYSGENSGMVEHAEQSLRKALEFNPGYDRARLNLVRILNRRGDYEEARALIDGVTDEGLTGYATLLLGDIYRGKGMLDSALVNYNESLQWMEDPTGPLNKMGLIYQQRGEFDQALPCFQRALERNPNHPTMLYNIAVTYLEMNEFERADSVTEEARRILPDDSDLHLLKAEIRAMQGETDEAIKWIGKALEAGYSDVDALRTNRFFSGIVNEPKFRELIEAHSPTP